MLNQEEARRLFDYNLETGELTWKVSLGSRALAGAKAGNLRPDGYLNVGVSRKCYQVHRVIWLWVHGYFPEHQIDHINRNPADNRLENLREVTRQCNIRNSNQFSSNTSGVTGVYWHHSAGKWTASIRINNRLHHLGCFIDFTEAVLTRLAAEQCLDWPNCDSSSAAYKFLKEAEE